MTRTLLGTPVLDPGPWAYAGTTTQMAGLFPFGAGSGAPAVGVPVGRHTRTHEVVCCDPFAWHEAGPVTNPGMIVLGSPGVGETSLCKRRLRGLMARGVRYGPGRLPDFGGEAVKGVRPPTSLSLGMSRR